MRKNHSNKDLINGLFYLFDFVLERLSWAQARCTVREEKCSCRVQRTRFFMNSAKGAVWSPFANGLCLHFLYAAYEQHEWRDWYWKCKDWSRETYLLSLAIATASSDFFSGPKDWIYLFSSKLSSSLFLMLPSLNISIRMLVPSLQIHDPVVNW